MGTVNERIDTGCRSVNLLRSKNSFLWGFGVGGGLPGHLSFAFAGVGMGVVTAIRNGVEDSPSFSLPGSPGLMPGLNGVLKGVGVDLMSPAGPFGLRGVANDDEPALVTCGLAVRNPLIGGAARGCGVAAEVKFRDNGWRFGLRGDEKVGPLLGVCGCLKAGGLNWPGR